MSLFVKLVATITTSICCFGQGQIIFANRVTGVFDAPVTLLLNPLMGPGPAYSAQLYLQQGTALTPLLPVQSFRAPGNTPATAIADRYLEGQPVVEVPGVSPGSQATFVMRAWLTSRGSFDAAKAFGFFGESTPFTITVGGGTLPPANLVTLQSFQIGPLPEPGTLVLGLLGGAALILTARLRRQV